MVTSSARGDGQRMAKVSQYRFGGPVDWSPRTVAESCERSCGGDRPVGIGEMEGCAVALDGCARIARHRGGDSLGFKDGDHFLNLVGHPQADRPAYHLGLGVVDLGQLIPVDGVDQLGVSIGHSDGATAAAASVALDRTSRNLGGMTAHRYRFQNPAVRGPSSSSRSR